MPGRNLEKIYVADSYYHIYSRGVNRELVFRDEEDYAVFLNLFKRYLSKEPVRDHKRREYPHFHGQIELLAFCLMPNHFHALIYQRDEQAIKLLFKSLITTYGMYFNKKYQRVGPVFQSRYRANIITKDAYLLHISRYIHLNPKEYKNWNYSSFPYYLGNQRAEWLLPERILDLFNGIQDYKIFVADYEDARHALKEIHSELANS